MDSVSVAPQAGGGEGPVCEAEDQKQDGAVSEVPVDAPQGGGGERPVCEAEDQQQDGAVSEVPVDAGGGLFRLAELG